MEKQSKQKQGSNNKCLKHLHDDAKFVDLEIFQQGDCFDKSSHGANIFYDAIEMDETIESINSLKTKPN